MSTQVAPPAVPAPLGSLSLYVGDLLPEVNEGVLYDVFNAVGSVASVRVCRDAATRRSLGYAYVNFHRAEDAERALDTMNFSLIRNKACRIMWSHRDPSLRKSGLGNVFVKNLAKSIDNKALYDTFSIFGNILSCKVAMNAKRESLGYGFVHYESDEAARNAIARVNGCLIADQQVLVLPFKSKRERSGNDKDRFTNLYVKNLPEDYDKKRMDELFAKFGEITSSMIASSPDEKSRGFGFVNFATAEEATAAVEGLNNYEVVPGKKLWVGRAQKKEEREKELRERFDAVKAERQKKYAGVNLYIKNLADNVDKERLIAEFSKFGQITSVRVMVEDSDPAKSRGFGFVCFATPEEATKAVTEMNGKMVEGKPLYVALAQRKEVRRAQLEQQHRQMGGMPPHMFPQGAPVYFPPQGMAPRMMFGPAGPMMAPRRWVGPRPGAPQQQMMGMGYPMMNGGSVNRGPNMAPRGARNGRQNGAGKQAGFARGPRNANMVPNGPQPGYKYSHQARNAGHQAQPAPAAGSQHPEGLTLAALAAAPEQDQKQLIGERLFPLVQQLNEVLAGKITGMLLEMDNGELLHLLEAPEALREKVGEAIQVLESVAVGETTN